MTDNNKALMVSQNNIDIMLKTATTLLKSGLMPSGVNTPEKVVVIMMAGQELGIGPIQALNGIHVIQGKPTVSPQLMLALINRDGSMENMKVAGDATQCTVTMKRKSRDPHTETFTIENAASMGLAGRDNWKKQPAVMLKWRAISACARVVFPDVIMGFYTTEEIHPDVTVDEQGDVIDSTAEPVAEEAQAEPEKPKLVEPVEPAPTQDNPTERTALEIAMYIQGLAETYPDEEMGIKLYQTRINGLFTDDDERHTVQLYVWGRASCKNHTDAQRAALVRYLLEKLETTEQRRQAIEKLETAMNAEAEEAA